jgi:hypothetical protein
MAVDPHSFPDRREPVTTPITEAPEIVIGEACNCEQALQLAADVKTLMDAVDEYRELLGTVTAALEHVAGERDRLAKALTTAREHVHFIYDHYTPVEVAGAPAGSQLGKYRQALSVIDAALSPEAPKP